MTPTVRYYDRGGWREAEVWWHGGMDSRYGGFTRGELLPPRDHGSTFSMLQPARGSSRDPDDVELQYRRSRGQAIDSARAERLLARAGMHVETPDLST